MRKFVLTINIVVKDSTKGQKLGPLDSTLAKALVKEHAKAALEQRGFEVTMIYANEIL